MSKSAWCMICPVDNAVDRSKLPAEYLLALEHGDTYPLNRAVITTSSPASTWWDVTYQLSADYAVIAVRRALYKYNEICHDPQLVQFVKMNQDIIL